MANIILTLDHTIQDGEDIKFKAPCACSEVSGITANYPVEGENGELSTATKTFTFRDTHGNDLTGLGNLFSAGAYVKVIVDTENNYAYLQNADTNKYLEGKLTEAMESGGGSGWTGLICQTSAAKGVQVIGTTGYTQKFAEPISIPYNTVVEFELIVYGAGENDTQGTTIGTLTLTNASGATAGKLVIDGSNYGATRRSTCIIMRNMPYVYTEEGEDHNASIQNSIPWSKSYGVQGTYVTDITGFTWTTNNGKIIPCYGYFLRYRIIEW